MNLTYTFEGFILLITTICLGAISAFIVLLSVLTSAKVLEYLEQYFDEKINDEDK